MAWKESRLIDIATDIIVYQGATHGEHAGKLSVLLTTKTCDVYGRGMNTLLTSSNFNTDFPMQEGGTVRVSSWVKVEKLCKLNIQKIIVGFGWGAAITRNFEMVTWGKGATTYLRDIGIETVQVYDPLAMCRFCQGTCDYGRRIGNTFFSYCKKQQTLVKYSSSPPPPDVPVKRLGNRRFGALTCSSCLMDCDIEVIESCSFNFCNNCNQLWDVDDNARPMNIKSVPLESFLRKLDSAVKVHDIAPGRWGIWMQSDLNRIKYSACFMHPDANSSGMPYWWKQSLSIPYLRPPHKIVSTHSTKTEVFAITDNGSLYRRVQVVAKNRSTSETHNLSRVPLEIGVRKMCSGRYASLCLLDDGSIWIVYSHHNRKDPKNELNRDVKEQTDAEELVSRRGSHGCLDVAGILYADLFYVHTNKRMASMRKKNPLTGSLIEILFGELDCRTFLWHFSDRCRVSGDGQISYDETAFAELINKQPVEVQRETCEGEPAEDLEESLSIPSNPTVTSAGLGIPVGVTLWSSWGSRLVQKAAVGWRCSAVISKRAYTGALSKLKKIWPKSHQMGGIASTASICGPQVVLPPFQSGLFGKPQFSDLTMLLRDGRFPAHRIILCSTSKYFKNKLGGSKFDVKSLDMKMHNPRAYRCLIKYFYAIEPEKLNIDDMLDLFSLAKIYDERPIIRAIEENIKTMIDGNNVTKIMEVATGIGSKLLQEECELYMKNDSAFQEKYGPNSTLTGTHSSGVGSQI